MLCLIKLIAGTAENAVYYTALYGLLPLIALHLKCEQIYILLFSSTVCKPITHICSNIKTK